jgi:2-polyprenyl-3-methyl-5-hydroxy-6-metoxy-1,4-benzoquinol methylase
MNSNYSLEIIACPFCGNSEFHNWAEENGFMAVKCDRCGLVYVNPRPSKEYINKSVISGFHPFLQRGKNKQVKHVRKKIVRNKKIIQKIFNDIWTEKKNISWLDVGAGYGEFMKSLLLLATKGSVITGCEPMDHKAKFAKENGLNVQNCYIDKVPGKFDFISMINIYSHIPDFHNFLDSIINKLNPLGELYIETGNIGDLSNYNDVPTELDLPDHLVFLGEKHLRKYLEDRNFTILMVERIRKDGIINFIKNIIKRILGVEVKLIMPYTSKYRSLIVRAKLNS